MAKRLPRRPPGVKPALIDAGLILIVPFIAKAIGVILLVLLALVLGWLL
jgi:hypothetical protein